MDMTLISALIDKVNASRLKSFEIEENGLRMRLENACPAFPAEAPMESTVSRPVVPPSSDAPEPPLTDEGKEDADTIIITSPLVGIFYPLEECGKSALTPGCLIEPGQIVCAIEAMKLINEVESTASGIYVKTLVKSGDQVEFGQPIMKLRKGE